MRLFIFGYGYTAAACAGHLRPFLSSLDVTVRSEEKAGRLRRENISASLFGGAAPDDAGLASALTQADTLLVSIPPDNEGDPALSAFAGELESSASLRSILYLSTIGVYGDFTGEWVDETTLPKGQSGRARRRLQAEKGWLDLGQRTGINVQILRLAGIYGPGRNALCDLRHGVARRLYKPDQIFNRIHVKDIALTATAALEKGQPGRIWNVTDDEPAPPQDVVAFAAELAGVPIPPLIDYETANLSDMARAFYSENKRVSNWAIRKDLGVELHYPTYREGLRALFEAGEGRNGAASLRQKARNAAGA